MKRSVLALAAGLASIAIVGQPPAALAEAAPAAATEGATLTVKLRGLTTGKGAAIVMLFNSDTAYDASKPLQSVKVDATASNVQAVFSGVAPGEYAIKAFYDVDNNGVYDQGTDAIGFSNHAVVGSSMPSFSDAAFTVKGATATQQITFNR
jgi:uncharacterized protein (DUF2141 family)